MRFSLFAAAAFFTAGLAAPAIKNGTAPSVPTVPSLPQIAEVAALVHTLTAEVEVELAAISKLAKGEVAIVVEQLDAICTKVKSTSDKLDSLIAGIVPIKSIASADITIVLALDTELLALLDKVEATVLRLTSTLTADALAILKPHLATLKATLGPLVGPVLTLAFGIVGTVKGDVSGTVGLLLITANDLKGAVAGLLAPVTGLLSGTLGGIL